MAIRFFAGGVGIGQVAVSLARKGMSPGPRMPAPLPAPMAIPAATSGSTLTIAREAAGYLLHLQLGGKLWGPPVPWWLPGGTLTDNYFDGLLTRMETAPSYADVKRQVGYALWLELPAEVKAFLAAQPDSPLHIESEVPVAPFEALQLDPRADGPLLGESRPITRWIASSAAPAAARLSVGRAACIRPEYRGADALPSAADEEQDLRARFAELTRVATQADLEALLDRSDVTLLHFAGHADGNPARLVLEGGPVGPEIFHPSRALFRQSPFLFLNGCRAAVGRSSVPVAQANMTRTLIGGAGARR
jgi:hypothetical protein